MAKLDILTLRARFVANAPTGVLVLYPNAPTTNPEPDTPFIRFSTGPMSSIRDSMGPNPRERTIGRVHLGIFVPRQAGDAQALDLADACAAIFRNWRWQSGADFLTCGTPDVQPIDNEPDWYQVKISVPWESLHQY